MRRLGLAILAGMALLDSVPAGADEIYDKCVDNPAKASNADWAECGAALLKREDDRLNATWKKVWPLVQDQTKADLLAEQRLWIAFKEKSCLMYTNGEHGREGAVLGFPTCRAEVIAARTRQLEMYGKSFEPM